MDTRGLTLCLVVVLAGCTGGGEMVTPAPVPAVATDTTTPTESFLPENATPRPNATIDGVAFPPGTDDRGILNASAIRTATAAALASEDVRFRGNWTVSGSGNRTVLIRRQIDDDRDRVRGTNTFPDGAFGGGTLSVEWYADGAFVAVNRTDDRESTYFRAEARNATTLRSEIPVGLAAEILASGTWTTRTTTTIGTRRAVVFELRAAADGYETASGTIAVTPDGVLRRAVVRRTSTADDRRRTTTFHYRLDTTEVTVDPPAWLDELDGE